MERVRGRRRTAATAPMFEPSFEIVLERAREGDARAFEQLFRALNRRVHGYARLRRAHDPEGVVNDVFLRVFTGLGSFTGSEAQFTAWVFTIARNRLVDEARRSQSRVVEVGVGDSPLARDVAASAEEQAEARGSTEAVLETLDMLTDEQRDVLVLRVVSDLSIKTVAEVLGKSPGAVKALQHRAIRTIAGTLSPQVVPR